MVILIKFSVETDINVCMKDILHKLKPDLARRASTCLYRYDILIEGK